MKRIKIYVSNDEMANVVNRAIAGAVFEQKDYQIVFDGHDFHYEEVVSKEFIRGYVIEHAKYALSDIPEGGENKGEELNDFQEWLAGELFIHVNGMDNYFYNHGILIINEK
jgi:hypothetical protein